MRLRADPIYRLSLTLMGIALIAMAFEGTRSRLAIEPGVGGGGIEDPLGMVESERTRPDRRKREMNPITQAAAACLQRERRQNEALALTRLRDTLLRLGLGRWPARAACS
ncbi:hypothetical protein [Streptosporangium amethystogenes]|uniref:hypothetical protein n=1 Tax=Streptosporangium amethystogenes TaxID=2002 RepID=UPI0012FB1D83|nr:hypothetical protein [Streptosporangium amethystogenes]